MCNYVTTCSFHILLQIFLNAFINIMYFTPSSFMNLSEAKYCLYFAAVYVPNVPKAKHFVSCYMNWLLLENLKIWPKTCLTIIYEHHRYKAKQLNHEALDILFSTSPYYKWLRIQHGALNYFIWIIHANICKTFQLWCLFFNSCYCDNFS